MYQLKQIQDISQFQCKIDFFFSQSSIFKSDEATCIPLLLFMSEMKLDLLMKQSNFLFLLGSALKLQLAYSVYSSASPTTTETQLFSNVFTGYVISCKQSLQMQISLKFHFDNRISRISRNPLRKNAYRGSRRPDVTNVTLALSSISPRDFYHLLKRIKEGVFISALGRTSTDVLRSKRP